LIKVPAQPILAEKVYQHEQKLEARHLENKIEKPKKIQFNQELPVQKFPQNGHVTHNEGANEIKLLNEKLREALKQVEILSR
jgi:hypothetical protein